MILRKLTYTMALVGALLALGCSPVRFSKSASCGEAGNPACKVTPSERRQVDKTITTGKPQADILFVDDNSGSMSTEQGKMGDKFPDFISSLGSIDYRIAITTTDVSSDTNPPSVANLNGALQDGKFIEFESGVNVLIPTLSNIAQLFAGAIKRPETLTCDSSGFKTCPSPDERGIYAANLAVDRADPDFFRPNAHLAVVILSDEDERSRGGTITGFELEDQDMPANFVANVKAKFGEAKSLAVHAIIIKPGDETCLDEQNSQPGVRGSEGKKYAELANLTNGTIGSICSSNYGEEMGAIGSSVADAVNSIDLECAPIDDQVTTEVNPRPSDLEITLDKEQKKIRFNRTLPAETTVRVIYDCPKA